MKEKQMKKALFKTRGHVIDSFRKLGDLFKYEKPPGNYG
jgi:hypothetical protein